MPSIAEANLVVYPIKGCEAKLNVGGSEATQDGALLEVESTDAGFEAAMAQGGRPQVSSFEILLNNVPVDLSNVTGNISVTRSYSNRLQTWTFSLVLTTPTGPLGSPFSCIGPPTGIRRVTINGCYKILSGDLAGSVVKVPIITDGIADSSTREASGEGTYTETISGVCRGGRYDQQLVTLVLPPGHGFPRGKVARLLAERAGESQITLEDGNPMYREVQVVDGDWLSVASEQQEVENRKLLWNAEGYLVNPKIGRPRSNETAWVTLDERNWLDLAVVSVSHKADVLTDVTLTGTEQMIDGPCGLESDPPAETRTFADYARATPTYSAAGGYPTTTFTANPRNPDAVVQERLVQLVRYTQSLRCGTVVYERTETEGWKNPLAVRQKFSVNAGGIGAHDWVHQDCFTNDNDQDSRSLAYQFGIEQWTKLTISESWHYYMQRDYVRPFLPIENDSLRWLSGPYVYTEAEPGGEWGGAFAGFYLGSLTRISGWTFLRKAIYSRSVASLPYDSWDDIEPDDDIGIIGNDGHETPSNLPFSQATSQPPGSPDLGEYFLPLSETVLNVRADEDGYKEKETTYESSWAHVTVGSAAEYKYGDGTESSEPSDSWGQHAITEVTYVRTGESVHKEITARYEFGQLVGGTEKSGIAGDLPAVERIEAPEWPEDLYESDEEFESLAVPARRSHTRQIKVRVTAPGLLTCHTEGILKTDIPLAENEDELKEIGKFLIDESLAADVQGTVLFNAYLRECQVIRAKHRPIGLDHDVRIETVSHEGPLDGPITTAITAKLYGGVQTIEEDLS